MRITLVMVSKDGEAKEFAVPRLPVTIGRDKDCKLRVPLDAVSRHHCELLVDDDELIVRDLKSSNGTYVNADRVKQRELVPGDLLAVGPVVFVVRIDGHPKEINAKDSYNSGRVAIAAGGAEALDGVPTWGAGGGGGGASSDGSKGGSKTATPGAGGAGKEAPKPAGKPGKAEMDDLLAGVDLSESDFDIDLDLDDKKKK